MPIDRPVNYSDPVMRQVQFQTERALTGWHRVEISPMARASPKARGYLHGLVIPMLADFLGECDRGKAFDDDEAWEWAKAEFRGREVVDPVTGNVRVVGKSTKGISNEELIEFTEKIRLWLLDRGVVVPDPDKNWQANTRPRYEETQQRQPMRLAQSD